MILLFWFETNIFVLFYKMQISALLVSSSPMYSCHPYFTAFVHLPSHLLSLLEYGLAKDQLHLSASFFFTSTPQESDISVIVSANVDTFSSF